MKISNSALVAFQTCPQLYASEFVEGWQKPRIYLEYGHRFHELLRKHYCPNWELPPTTLDEDAENECQAMFEAYKAFYPTENFEVVECERRFELGIGELYTEDLCLQNSEEFSCASHPNAWQHQYLGKFDMLVRNNETHKLQLFESKTEARGSKRNLPKAWVARTQASLYLWAATTIFGESIDSIILNVCTKGSEKGRVGPSFRRDTLQRTPTQVKQALDSLLYVADQVERIGAGPFPRNTNSCVSEFGWDCDMYQMCHFGVEPSEAAGLIKIEPYQYLSL